MTWPQAIRFPDCNSRAVGKDEKEKQKNAEELNGYVIEVNTKNWPVSGGVIQRFVIRRHL